MSFLQALLLSIVEGISEFLPISSTGHLVLTAHLLQIPQTEFVKSFEIIIQLGAILAICLLYYPRLLQGIRIWKPVLAAFIPTAIVGLILYKIIKTVLLGNEWVTISALLIGGVIMIVLEKVYKEKEHRVEKIENVSLKTAVSIGLLQSLSVIPGVSRSAASILGGMFLGLKRQTAVEFSFLLAIPTMLAATGLDLVKSQFSFNPQEWSVLAVGFIGSFLAALFVVKWFVKYMQKHDFIGFGVYRIVLSILYYLIILR